MYIGAVLSKGLGEKVSLGTSNTHVGKTLTAKINRTRCDVPSLFVFRKAGEENALGPLPSPGVN